MLQFEGIGSCGRKSARLSFNGRVTHAGLFVRDLRIVDKHE